MALLPAIVMVTTRLPAYPGAPTLLWQPEMAVRFSRQPFMLRRVNLCARILTFVERNPRKYSPPTATAPGGTTTPTSCAARWYPQHRLYLRRHPRRRCLPMHRPQRQPGIRRVRPPTGVSAFGNTVCHEHVAAKCPHANANGDTGGTTCYA